LFLLKKYGEIQDLQGGVFIEPSLVNPAPSPSPARSPTTAPGGPPISAPDIAIDNPVDIIEDA
jgi:hypothetical protein